MEGISDIKIVSIDEKRPPRIRKEPYIDIIFKLSHQAPADWCKDFNDLLADELGKPKIDEKEGLYIDAWVRKPDEIVALLDMLKQKTATCSQQYIERVEQEIRSAANTGSTVANEETGEQGRLNNIVAALIFDEVH